MIEIRSLVKCYGSVRAVDDISFTVGGGKVTAYLGPNGAGKTTTLRMLLGLVRPDAGSATLNGKAYASLPSPMRVVGASLENSAFHPGRSGRSHLGWIAAMGGIPQRRVDEVLGQVGLADAANRKVGGYSLGMRQRLGLAAALLGDPAILVLDEPANGLDPDGILWLRVFLRSLANEGRTVLISSHVLREVDQTATDAVIIVGGRLRASGPIAELTRHAQRVVRVRTPDRDRFLEVLQAVGMRVNAVVGETIDVVGSDPAEVGRIAAQHAVVVTELTVLGGDLEAAFFELVHANEGVARQ